jgi:hypothetical protein
MKLIRGRTLAAVLTARQQRPSSRSADELDLTALDSPGLLHIFEQICQTVGYAHAQGVIHRDLKPSNVMLGSFGEVLVMDWGIAKILGDNSPLTPSDPEERSPEYGAPEQTRLGRAMGTPQYMPPEQARGEWLQVDTRADVFALGGILAAILTGSPPHTGESPQAVLERAARADLSGCIARLDASGAAAELIDLAKWCLAPNPNDRPANAGAVAQQIAAFRLSTEARLMASEAERAAAGAQAAESRRRAEEEVRAARDANEHAAAAVRTAEEALATARSAARRWRGVAAAVTLIWLILSALYGNYREKRWQYAPFATPSTEGSGSHIPPPHAAPHFT